MLRTKIPLLPPALVNRGRKLYIPFRTRRTATCKDDAQAGRVFPTVAPRRRLFPEEIAALAGLRNLFDSVVPPWRPTAIELAADVPTAVESDRMTVTGVSKRYGDVHALSNVSFDVAPGEFLTLLGPSGCGKTTLLRVIAGLELPDAGVITLGNRRLDQLPAQHRPVNTVFQSYSLFPHLNVFENVAFGLRARKYPDVVVREKVAPTLALLQIEPLTRRYPHQLSGGQKQRVALARALVNEPSVLLLDEPMSALDAKLRAEVRLELRRLQRRLRRTFILVTHDQDEAMTVSDRVIVMHDGRIAQSGTPVEVYERPRNRFVAEFLGAANLVTAQRNGDGFNTPLGKLHPRENPPWNEGLLTIRPERIHVVGSAPAENSIQGVVREVVYCGAYRELLVDPGPLRVHVSAARMIRPGDAITLDLPREHLGALIE